MSVRMKPSSLLVLVAVVLSAGAAWGGEGCDSHSKDRSHTSVAPLQSFQGDELFIDEGGEDDARSDQGAVSISPDPTEVTSTAVKPSNDY